jgi:mannose-6-phosphate isomerase-like protein (cupin superfamily)
MSLLGGSLNGAIDAQKLAFASPDDLIYPKDEDEASSLWGSGKTAIVQSLQSSSGVLNAIAATLEVEEQTRVSCSAYVSQASASSFGFHVDDWDVYIVQIEGEKTFFIKEGESTRSVDLGFGDFLYIPRGILHKAHSMHGSTHLSFNYLTFPARVAKETS